MNSDEPSGEVVFKPGIRWILAGVLALPILLILVNALKEEAGMLGLIRFGETFAPLQVPEVVAIGVPVNPGAGYDGQFYAQMAVDPSLRGAGIEQALDNAPYRARRIGMPALAWLLGGGDATRTLQAYAWMNFLFWGAGMALLCRLTWLRRPRDFFLGVALLWSMGTLVSVSRALTDLPAAILGWGAVFWPGTWWVAAFLLGASNLVKETSVLGSGGIPIGRLGDWKARILTGLVLFGPLASWWLYTQWAIESPPRGGGQNFAWPLIGLLQKLFRAGGDLITGWPDAAAGHRAFLLWDLLAPVSLAFQAAYMLARPDWSSRSWRWGAGFGILAWILGPQVWVDPHAYCRVLLPLTFAYNLVIHSRGGRGYAGLWLVGNLGLGWMVYSTLSGY